jgi:hypothetical protein
MVRVPTPAVALATSGRRRAADHIGRPQNFPDPTFSGANQTLNLPAGINPDSPGFQRAAKACGLSNP